MKKTISILLCLALLFSLVGCAMLQPVDGPGMVNEQTEPQASADPAAPEASAQEPAEASAESGAPEETLTDRTGEVNTDYSAYAPRSGGLESLYTRLSEQTINELAPGNYGEIFPFTADDMMSYDPQWDTSYSLGRYYGFVTGEGMIVCDPVYTGISRLQYWDATNEEMIVLPLWTMESTTDVKTVTEGEYSWLSGDSVYAVAAQNGSFVTPMEFRSVSAYPGGFIGIRSTTKLDFDVYDLRGHRLFGAAELGDTIPVGEYYNISYSDGVFILSGYADDNYRYYAFDETGTLLFGPMYFVSNYCNGLASASMDGDTYGYIDKQGNWLVWPSYTSADSFRDGLAICYDGDNPIVIDKHGVERIRAYGGWMWRYDDYFIFSTDSNGQTVYDSTGAVVFRAPDGEYWSWVDGSVFCNSNDDDSCTLRDMATGKTKVLPNVSWVRSAEWYDEIESGMPRHLQYYYNGQPCFVGSGTNSNGDYCTVFIDRDLNVIAELANCEFQIFFDSVTGEVFMGIGDSSRGYDAIVWELARVDGTVLGNYAQPVRIYDGWVQTTDNRYARLYDPDGNLVFCYPLLSMIGD